MKCLVLITTGLAFWLLPGCGKAFQPSHWRTLVPPAQRALTDPLPSTAANVAAGAQTYQMYCIGCHRADAGGSRAYPSLRNARVRGESDGELEWILLNGSKGHGMPAWRSLGTTDLWQLVQYLRSLPLQK